MKKTICLVLAAILMLSLVACKETVVNDPEEFRIITSFYPVYVATANIVEGAENVTLLNLTEPDLGCMHDYALTTEDLKLLNTADLFIASGMGMEAFVSKASLGIPQLELLDCGEDIRYIVGDEDEEQNPHYWMNIQNAIDQCDKIKRTLCTMDPDNADIYEKNAEGYKAKLQALMSEAEERTSKLTRRDMVVFHDSFDYFAEQYGLNIVSVLSSHDGSAPSAKTVADTVEFMKSNKINVVFTEKSLSEQSVLETVTNETGCNVYVLDTLTSGEINENTKDAYINAVRHNLNVLEQALS